MGGAARAGQAEVMALNSGPGPRLYGRDAACETVAEVAPPPVSNVTEHDEGGVMAEPVGVTGLGIRPSWSAGPKPLDTEMLRRLLPDP